MQPNPPRRPILKLRRRRLRWWMVLLVLVLAGGGYWLWHGMGKGTKNDKKPQAPVTLAPTARKDMPVYLTGLGTVQAYNTVTMHTQVDGQLIAVKFREGQMVRTGDVLAQIDPRTYKAAYDQAVANEAKDAAQLANARVDLKRYQKLGNSVAGQILDTQRATVKQLEATVAADTAAAESAQTQLSYTTITSPINGRTGIRQVDVGNIVHAADTGGIVVVTQLEPISVIFSLPQQNLEAINTQIAVQKKLTLDALAADNATVNDSGVLELVDNEIDPTTGTIKLKATFPNRKHVLWPGGFTNVRLLLSTEQGALTIPVVAIQHGPQGAYVFLYQPADSTVVVKPVTVGIVEDQDAIITEGLTDGDQVVTDGMAKLQDKSHVTLGGVKPPAASGDAAAPASASDAAAVPASDAPAEAPKPHTHKHGDAG